jgi:hypothetical protein
MLRPFLLLVAMPPMFRNQVACFLGWSIITEGTNAITVTRNNMVSDYFGDVHKESWKIISSRPKGMQTRCNHSYEKVNPFVDSCNWYDGSSNRVD